MKKIRSVAVSLVLVATLLGVAGCIASLSSETSRSLSSSFGLGASSAPAEDEGEDLKSFCGTIQKLDDSTCVLDGGINLESETVQLDSYVGQEVCIRGIVITEEPLKVEVRTIRAKDQQEPGPSEETPPVGTQVNAYGILQKINGVYSMDAVILQSSVVDLGPYVGQLVHLKGEVIGEEPLTIEVLAVEWF